MRPAGKGHGWCCLCCSCCCWRRSAARRDIQTEREPAIKKYIPTGVTPLPLSRPNPPSDVAAYAPAQVPPKPLTPFPSAPVQLLISINDKHIAKALWAPRPCPRNAYIIYIRITINVVPQTRRKTRRRSRSSKTKNQNRKQKKEKKQKKKKYRKASKVVTRK